MQIFSALSAFVFKNYYFLNFYLLISRLVNPQNFMGQPTDPFGGIICQKAKRVSEALKGR